VLVSPERPIRLRRPWAGRPVFLALTAATLSAAVIASGCDKLPFLKKTASAPSPAAVATPKPAPKLPDIDYASVRPNELGKIPVLMYHEIGGKPAPKDPALVRTVEGFKKDLELLYAAGFRPVNLADVVNDRIDVPAGKSPVVLTFDDARGSQFKLDETDKELKIDPNCAVGILKAFHDAHPDWGMKGTFFVLPKSKVTLDAFGQLGLGNQKMSWLVSNGFELGNHTTFHKSLRHMSPAQIQAEIGNANNRILEAVPGYKVETMAVPMGIFPRDKGNWKYLIHGTYEGKTYDYKVAMLAAYRPIVAPSNKKFDPFRLERIAPNDADPNGLRSWIQKLSAAAGDRYVSDGDPNVISFPKGDETLVNTARLKADGKTINPYSPFGTGSGAKPIVMDGPSSGSGTTASPSPGGVAVTEKPIGGG